MWHLTWFLLFFTAWQSPARLRNKPMSFVEHFLSSILSFIKSQFSRQSTVLERNSNQDSEGGRRRKPQEGRLPSVRTALLPQLACEKKFEVISLARNDKVSVIQVWWHTFTDKGTGIGYRIPCAHRHDVEYSSRRAVWPTGPAPPEKP